MNMKHFIELKTTHLKNVAVNPYAVSGIREVDKETCELFMVGNFVLVSHGYGELVKMFTDFQNHQWETSANTGD